MYARHHRMVLGLCRALLRDGAEAEDAAQQTFLSAHRSLLNGADPREPAAWLATIARNECWARISARMRRPLATGETDAVVAASDPLDDVIRSADLAALWRAIRELPRSQRDALLLREFGGLRYDELAVALAVTEPAVESLLVRARARLRAQLRTAYASLAPAIRFLVGSGAPAVAAKAAALGLGAAAVGGGVAVAPEMLTRHHFQHPPVAATAATQPRRVTKPVPAVVVPTRQVLPPATTTAAATIVRERRHRSGRGREDEHGDDSADVAATVTVPATTTATEDDRHGGGDGTGGDSGSHGGDSGPDGGSGGRDDGS
ncbi:MAG: sigma-70 family RNA polymerase sigma factor [Actinomycetota bacterium]